MSNRIYILMIVGLVLMFFTLTTLSQIEAPLREIAQLPKCQANDVVLTTQFMTNIKNFASNYIINGTGESYFNNHYQYLDTSYSTIECTFVVKYVYTYDELHEIMSITVSALSTTSYDVTKTNAFLRPVNVLVTNEEVELIALQHNVSYDYYNKEVSLIDQSISYRFYKETLTQGTLAVLEVDAQSKAIIELERPREIIPMV